MEQTTIKQNRRLRRRILQLADAAKASGGLRGRMLMDILADGPAGPEDDQALIGLCRDLGNAGFLAEKDLRKRVGDRFGLDHLLYSITALGTSLLSEGIPPHPLVEDERIVPE